MHDAEKHHLIKYILERFFLRLLIFLFQIRDYYQPQLEQDISICRLGVRRQFLGLLINLLPKQILLFFFCTPCSMLRCESLLLKVNELNIQLKGFFRHHRQINFQRQWYEYQNNFLLEISNRINGFLKK